MKKYVAIFERTGTGFSAYVPDLPGCVASGDTKQMAERNIYEAIIFHLEGLAEDGELLPDTMSEAETLLFAV
jgi:predicted RNase H-like HicB family nuclease